MSDAVEIVLIALAALLGGAALVLCAQVIRTTWHDAWRTAHPDAPAESPATRPPGPAEGDDPGPPG